MKNEIINFLSKTKIIVSTTTIFGIIVLVLAYGYVGRAPIVKISNENSANYIFNKVVDLSFAKGGRLENVFVKVGQEVKKGDLLANLYSPDAKGTVAQTKGALDLAESQYNLLNSQYETTKKQQDLLVTNAYQVLLSSGLEGVPSKQDLNTPIISGTYTCDKEGIYYIDTYASADNDTGYSFRYSGLEEGIASVKYDNSIPLGNCGLQIKWNNKSFFNDNIDWTINIPNKKGSVYLANKNAYELALATREKTLSDLSNTIGSNNQNSVAKAQVDTARGAYEAALGAYQNNLIVAPEDGIIYSVDNNLKVGQNVLSGKPVISLIIK